jgi:uncharacterized heparinase superfamily protein
MTSPDLAPDDQWTGNDNARPHGRVNDAALFVRTLALLRPTQVLHRVRLRTLQAAERRWPELATRSVNAPAGVTLGWPAAFHPLDISLDHGDGSEIAEGRFRFLNEERSLGEPADWCQAGAPRLWRFHLHYFEWAWALAQAPDRTRARESFARLWRSWRASMLPAQRDGWSPSVASLRVWVLCGVFDALVRGGDIETDYLEQIAWHAGYVRSHLELDLSGNHLLKNIKALVGAGEFLSRPDLVSAARSLLEAQLPIQVLADGGHFERSSSYHCQVLGDLIDIRELLAGTDAPPVAGLDSVIKRMRQWLGAMVGGDGEVALCNDAVPVGVRRITALAPESPLDGPVTVLAASGYVVIRPDEHTQLILDVGDPCPDDLPGHAHADCLSFELWVGHERWVVDTGTSTYEPGPRRAYERSTTAHNTVEIDGEDQTEVWGIFRAARRARGTLELVATSGSTVEVVASHDGYRRLPGSPVHRRRWRVSPGRVEITDTVAGTGSHHVVSRLHVAPEAALPCSITGRGGGVTTETCTTAWGFGRLRPAIVHRIETGSTDQPMTFGWLIEWVPLSRPETTCVNRLGEALAPGTENPKIHGPTS